MPLPSEGPALDVTARAVEPADSSENWHVTWSLVNTSALPLTLLAAWQPHGRFRAAERALEPPLALAPAEACTLTLPVRCVGAPGEQVENCFLIFRARWADAAWQILARVTIHIGADGVPWPTTELITTQPVGFGADAERP